MRLFMIAIVFVIGGCGHMGHSAGGSTAASSVSATPPEVELAPSRPLPNLSGLRLTLKQGASGTNVILEFTLANAGSTPVKITNNPRFGHRTFGGHREDEFEIQLIDRRGRWIPYRCTDCRLGLFQAEEALLQPGEVRTFSLSLMPGCYSFAPGERLSFIATFANIFEEDTTTTRIFPEVQPSGWIDIVVPLGWQDEEAAQQGVAPVDRSPAAPARR
jgi:hypothetical protein